MAGKEKKKKTFGDVIITLLMLLALAVFVYAGYTLYGYYMQYKAGQDEYKALNKDYTTEETEDYDLLEDENQDIEARVESLDTQEVVLDGETVRVPTLKNPIDFESLQAQYPDMVAWLKIRALDISYPVMYGEDNDYYLHRGIDGEYLFAGSIFLNCDNKPDFSDMNSILYGHNMRDGSMFGKIKKFSDEETFNKSKYFWIFTPDLIYQYRIFSVAVVDQAGISYQTYYSESSFEELLDYAFTHSEVDVSGVDVSYGDKIATLSTCTGDSSTRRVVYGKLVQVYASRE